MDNKKLKKAFTLSEILMTLTIIGVISALTIPTLKNHADESSFIALTKKAYLTASNAITTAESKHGDLELWNWKNQNEITKYFQSSMNLTPNANFSAYDVRRLDGTVWNTIGSTYFQTTDGMLWYIYMWPDMTTYNHVKRYGIIHVDVNGAKGPNVIGVDMHAFNVSSDGVTPMGDSEHDNNTGWACTNYIIKYGKMPWYSDTSYTGCNSVYGK